MGCHTWYSVPVLEGKAEIIKAAQKNLDDLDFLSDDHKRMYQYAIDNELCNVVCELAQGSEYKSLDGEGWIVYQDEHAYVVAEHNKMVDLGDEVGLYDYDEQNRRGLEWCGSEPRIGGYPEKVIRSYEEMIQFMSDGYHGTHQGEPHHYTFRVDDDRKDRVMANIERFFKTYPKGIIVFG